MRVIGEIPARLGSQRVKMKNLKLLNGKPMISYAVEAALGSKRLSEVYVNSESEEIGAVGEKLGARFYRRDPRLASDNAKSDEFNYDFIKGTHADVLVLVNPVAPLIEAADIDQMLAFFFDHDYDTLITAKEEQLHAYCGNRPINFNPDGMLARTQDIEPVSVLCWCLAIWRAKTFLAQFREKGYAAFSGKVGRYVIDPLKAVKVSTEEDFMLAEALLAHRERTRMPTC